jgi:tRNA(Ile)-lysidine synthase
MNPRQSKIIPLSQFSMSLSSAFRKNLKESGLIPPESTVVVGYSGGADSTALLVLLQEAGIDVIAAHLHHGMRPEADKEAKLAQAFCEERNIPFISGRADIPTMATHLKVGIEEAGRMARYEFFRKAQLSTDAPLIATGHTQDDQVETILFNLVRGTGLAGLAGIPRERQGIIRPLLSFTRAQTRAFCEERGFWFHDDPGNFDVAFSRVRLRERVMPELRLVHPGAEESILRLSEIASEEDGFLDQAAAKQLQAADITLNGKLNFLTRDVECAFDRATIEHLPPVLYRRALRLIARFFDGHVERDQIAAMRTREGSVTLSPGDVVIEWDERQIHARRLSVDEFERFPVTFPGQTVADSFGWVLQAMESPDASDSWPRASLEVEVANVKGNLFFRSLEPGDRLIPAGFDHERKLSDLVGESKLTLAARKRLPIICDMLGPVWVPGVVYAERNRAERGKRAIRLTLLPLNETSGRP